MPVHYKIDPGDAHVRVTGTGPLSMPAMIAEIERVAADARFCSDFTIIFDLRAVEYSAELNDGGTLAAVLKQKKTDFRNRFALVVPQRLHFLATLYCELAHVAGFDRIRCFTEMGEAREWCGVSQ